MSENGSKNARTFPDRGALARGSSRTTPSPAHDRGQGDMERGREVIAAMRPMA
jgi:hypothetical protein